MQKKSKKGIYKLILTCYNNDEYIEKGAKEMAYIFERSNEKHQGILYMKDGNAVKDSIISLVDFIKNCNDAGDLIDPNYPFLSFISKSFSKKEDLNNFLSTIKVFNAQLSDPVVQMKQRGALVQVPDAEYWNRKFDAVSRKVEERKMSQLDGSKLLASEFYETVKTCIKANHAEAKRYNIDVPTLQTPDKTK